jgi:hypothetical protein
MSINKNYVSSTPIEALIVIWSIIGVSIKWLPIKTAIIIRIVPWSISIITRSPIIETIESIPIGKSDRPIIPRSKIGSPVGTISKIVVNIYLNFVTFLTPTAISYWTF